MSEQNFEEILLESMVAPIEEDGDFDYSILSMSRDIERARNCLHQWSPSVYGRWSVCVRCGTPKRVTNIELPGATDE